MGTYTSVVTTVHGTYTSAPVVVADKPAKPTLSDANLLVCPGESVRLTASGCTNYEWSSGQTTSSITISPTVSTTYTVKCKEGADCYSDPALAGVQVGGLTNTSVLTGVAATNQTSRASRIQSTQIVNANVNHTYRAAKSVELNPGFKADGQSIFKVEVDANCGN